MSTRSEQLADRIDAGARYLIDAVRDLSDEQWTTYCPGEQRTVAALVHHVGSAYALEGQLITALAGGGKLEGMSWEMVDAANAQHGEAFANVDRETAFAVVRDNAKTAADAVRPLTDDQLDMLAPTFLNWDAPLTLQFLIEQHPILHPWTHLQSIKEALGQ